MQKFKNFLREKKIELILFAAVIAIAIWYFT